MKYDYSQGLFQNVRIIYKVLTQMENDNKKFQGYENKIFTLESKVAELEKTLKSLK